MGNAVKYTATGEISVSAEVRSTVTGPRELVIVVADTYNLPLLRFLARLKEYAIAIECFILDWMPADLGMRWQRGQEAEWLGIGDKTEKPE